MNNAEKNCLIKDYIRESSTRNKDGSVFNVLSVSNKNGFIKQSEQFEDKELASEDKTNYKKVKRGILIIVLQIVHRKNPFKIK